MEAVVSHLRGESSKGTFEQLKAREDRHVFRCMLEDTGLRTVVKSFTMTSLQQKLWRHNRYAPADVRNLIEARWRGIQAPEVYGFGWRQRGPFVQLTVAMIEDLVGYSALTRVGALEDADTQRAMLRSVADQLAILYLAGCNHIDLGAANVFVAEDGSNDVRVIDFMHVRFLPGPSGNVLAYQAAYLADSLLPCGVTEERLKEWASYLFSHDRIDAPAARLWEVYERHRGRRLSRKERYEMA